MMKYIISVIALTLATVGQAFAQGAPQPSNLFWATPSSGTGNYQGRLLVSKDLFQATSCPAAQIFYNNAGAIGCLPAGTSSQVLVGGAVPAWGTVNLATMASGLLPVVNGGTGTATPGLVAGTNVTITGSWPNQTIAAASGGGGSVTSVGFVGGIISVATATTTPALTVAGTSGGIPFFSGATTWASSTLLVANQIVVGGGAGTAPATLGTLGTTTTVLHGNAAGAPTFAAVSLTADITGTLPIANGGTGQTTASAAFNALSPLTTAGDILYGGTAGAGTRLAAGTSSQVLIGGTVPSWGSLNLATMASGNLPIANLGSGTGATSSTFWRGDGTWSVPAGTGGGGSVTNVSWVGGIVSIASPTTTPAFTIAGTSGGIPYFSNATTWASSAVLVNGALMQGGGAGVAPSTFILAGDCTFATPNISCTKTGGVAFGSLANLNAAPAGTLTGATLNATVLNSSLTSVGTIATGVWNGTTIAIANGGSGQTTAAAHFNAVSPMTTAGDLIYGGTAGAGTRLASGTSSQFLVSGTTPAWTTMSGDCTLAVGVITCTKLNSVSPGTLYSLNAAPAGTLTGATLAAGVTASSLTSVGTLTSGTWNGTTIAIGFGGSGQTTASAAFNAFSPMTTAGDIIYGGTAGAGTRLAAGTSSQILMSGTTPAWTTMSGDCTMSIGVITCTKTNSVALGSLATLSAAPAGTLTGTTLNSTVVTSSLTSVGTLTGLTDSGNATIKGILSNSGGAGYGTTVIDNSADNTNGIQVTAASTTQAQEITKAPIQITWNPGFTGTPGSTFNTASLVATTTSTVNDQIYPWGIIGIVNNFTDMNTTGNPNAVAVNGTTFTKSVTSSQASSSWGGNFVCDETTAAAIANPTHFCLGAELDVYEPTGSGTDNNAKRIGLYISAGPKTADTTVHAFAGIDIASNGTIDNGITFYPQSSTGNITTLINVGLTPAHYTNLIGASNFSIDNSGNILTAGNITTTVGSVQMPAVANGSVATAMSSLGPAGSHTTVQEWFPIKNASGVVRYVPAF